MYTKHLNSSLLPTCFVIFFGAVVMAAADNGDRLADMVPEDIAFAIAVPNGFRLENGDAQVTFEYEAGATKLSGSIILDISRSASFVRTVDATRNVYIGKFGEVSKQQFKQFQKAIARIKEDGQKGSGSVAISVIGGCFSAKPLDTLRISTWIQLDANRGYIALVRNRNLFSFYNSQTRNRLMKNLRTCQ